jgi:hypothetical protein
MRFSSMAVARRMALVIFAPLIVFALMALLATVAHAQDAGELLDWACTPDNAALLKSILGLLGLHFGASVASAFLKKFSGKAGSLTAIVRLVALDLHSVNPPKN